MILAHSTSSLNWRFTVLCRAGHIGTSIPQLKLCTLILMMGLNEIESRTDLFTDLGFVLRLHLLYLSVSCVDVKDEQLCPALKSLGIAWKVWHMSSFRTAQIRLVSSHRDVYEPCDDSFVLVDALLADRINLLNHHPTMCLEVGCGSGYVITSLALMLGKEASGTHYIATDINPHAMRVTQETLDAHGVHAELITTDIASGLEKRLAGSVDVLVVNPPYVPTPEDEVGREGIASAWAGGENGRSVIDRILPVADVLLSDKGWLYMVTLAVNNPSQICIQMREKGYASRIVVQRSTEEENLHVIKFWKDADLIVDGKDSSHKTGPARVLGSLISQFPRLSFRRNNSNTNR